MIETAGSTGPAGSIRSGLRDRRVGFHLVDLAERVGRHGPFAHQPAAVVDVLGRIHRAEGDLRRPQQVHRAAHAVGDPPGDEPLVVVQRLLVGVAVVPQRRSRRMRVGGGDEHVLRRDSRLLVDQPPRFDADAAVQAEQIADHQRQAGSGRRPEPGSGRAVRRARARPGKGRSRPRSAFPSSGVMLLVAAPACSGGAVVSTRLQTRSNEFMGRLLLGS
jgi:hypothetical protein